ncbi:MAG: hypothetical protein KGI03_03205 [Patescibacteria group bacterium]|nr:hypothetical protein [Patescibacteria group bacterium]
MTMTKIRGIFMRFAGQDGLETALYAVAEAFGSLGGGGSCARHADEALRRRIASAVAAAAVGNGSLRAVRDALQAAVPRCEWAAAVTAEVEKNGVVHLAVVTSMGSAVRVTHGDSGDAEIFVDFGVAGSARRAELTLAAIEREGITPSRIVRLPQYVVL